MGNLSSNISQNIQEFANNLIEEERSKSNSLNQSSTILIFTLLILPCLGDYEEEKQIIDPGGGGQTYINGKIMNQSAFYPTFTQKTIRVLVDSGIQLDVDILNDNLTCGWLISEVTRMYTELLVENNRLASKYAQQEKDFKHLVQQSRRQQLNFNQGGKPMGLKKEKKKLIVALKTYEGNENLDHWLTMYDKQLHPVQDGEVLVAYFAKICPNKKKQISAEDFELIKVIGRGGFSRVILCRKKDTGRLYAMKILKKSKIIREKKIKPILSERNILEHLDHPFIVKLHWAFQSKEELFFVMDICTGGEIFFHLNNFKKFPEALAKFYFIEILLGLEYLHKQEIVYRDIKPENILVDIDGHVKIADFGLAKLIPNRQKSFSFCGSPEYMSPEMLKGRGHDKQLDYYCLGALLYEMLTGLPPYYSKDTNEMYKKILNEELSFPDYLLASPSITDLLSKLLSKETKTRIKSIDEIRRHPWLKDTPWKMYLNKEVMPPFVPSMREPNFDPEFNDLPIDFDELQIKLRMSTERRQSYYYESTLQSKTCTENSFYFNNHPGLAIQEEILGNTAQLLNQNQALFSNFFNNPGDDIKDIYNDSSGTNNTSNANTSIPNIKQRPSNTALPNTQFGNNSSNNNNNNQSATSQNLESSDVFKNFSFYDSPLEENEIISQIKRCCIKIGQLPQHLYPTNPTKKDQQQLSQNLQKLQSNMSQWMSSSRRFIQEELEEEDEASNQKSSQQDQEGEDGQLHALPSEFSGTSIVIEQSDITIDPLLPNYNHHQNNTNGGNTGGKKKKQQISSKEQKESNQTQKNKDTTAETWKEIETLQIVLLSNDGLRGGLVQSGIDDFTNAVGSFSSKSINTYDESNQSVAQELRTNESIALNTYSIANQKQTVNPKLMNSDELVVNEVNQMVPVINHHHYKKSMINPATLFKPSLEIQLPEIDHEALLSKQIKQDSSTHKSSPFLPKMMITPNKKQQQQQQQLSEEKGVGGISGNSHNNLLKKTNSGRDLQALSHQKASPKAIDSKKQKLPPTLHSILSQEHSPNHLTQFKKPQQQPPQQLPKNSFVNATHTKQISLNVNTQNTYANGNNNGNVGISNEITFKFSQSPQIMQKMQDMNSTSPLSTVISLVGGGGGQQQLPQQQEYKHHSRMQEQQLVMGNKKSFTGEISIGEVRKMGIVGGQEKQDEEGVEIEVSAIQIQQKRQAAKFRSMDFSQNQLSRATSLKTEERIILEPRNNDEKQKQEILSDLQEASKEGNSISLSPLRSCLPDMRPNHPNNNNKIPTLKGIKEKPSTNKGTSTKLNQLAPSKNNKALDHDQISIQTAKTIISSKNTTTDLNAKKKTKAAPIKIESQIHHPSSIASKKSPTNQQFLLQQQQQQTQITVQQQKQVQPKQPKDQQLQQDSKQPEQTSQQQAKDEPNSGKTPHSSKNASVKPNLFSEKSQSSLNLVPILTITPTTPQITGIQTTSLKNKIDFFNNSNAAAYGSAKEYGSTGGISTSSNNTQPSPSVQSSTQPIKKVQTQIKKKLISQMDGAVSRNDNNSKMSGSAGVTNQTGTGGSIGSKKTTTTTTLTKKKGI